MLGGRAPARRGHGGARARGLGVIAKRPIANAAWKTRRTPASGYHQEYWRRLRALDYGCLKRPRPESVGTALGFTLSVAGVHTAIVGTAEPERWRENAALLARARLAPAEVEAIRARWRAVARPDWVGQT